MTLNELIIRLNEIREQNPMNGELLMHDTDGNPIIAANISDMPDEPIVYIESSF